MPRLRILCPRCMGELTLRLGKSSTDARCGRCPANFKLVAVARKD